MHTGKLVWGESPRLAAVWCCVVLVAGMLVLNFGGCPMQADQALLSASQDAPDRVPPGGSCQVTVLNDSTYAVHVTVDRYIGQTVIHHSEAVLAPAGGSDLSGSTMLDWDEADRVVIAATVKNSQGDPLWSDQKTYMLGTDFQDGDTVEYAVIYPPRGTAPVVSINAPKVVDAGAAVTLDGSASYDPGGKALTYAWEQISGAIVELLNADQPVASFAVPTSGAAGTMVFRLTLSNGVETASGQVSLAIANRAPTASITGPNSAYAGDTVTLDGSYSTDPDGDPLQTNKPNRSVE